MDSRNDNRNGRISGTLQKIVEEALLIIVYVPSG